MYECEIVTQEKLHATWPFIERGLKDICRRNTPDWIEHDVYAAIRANTAWAFIVRQESRRLGFFVLTRNTLPFSGRTECLIWCGWALPLRERLAEDGFPAPVAYAVAQICNIARGWGAVWIAFLTSRRGFERRGVSAFKSAYTSYRLELGVG